MIGSATAAPSISGNQLLTVTARNPPSIAPSGTVSMVNPKIDITRPRISSGVLL